MTTKEEVGLVVAGMGVWYAVRRSRRAGAVIAGAGVLVSALAIAVVIPHYNAGAESSFYGRYDAVGGSAGGIAKTAVTHPWTLFEQAFQHRDLHFLLHLLVPLSFLFVLSPLLLVAFVPEPALNQLSATPDADVDPLPLHGRSDPAADRRDGARRGGLARRFPTRTTAVIVTAVAVAVAANWKLGALPLWTVVPGGEDFQAHDWHVTAHDRTRRAGARARPAGAVVSSTNVLGAHLSARRKVLSLPKLGDATWVVADETRSSYADRVAPLPSAAALVRLRQSPDWRLVFEEDGVLVFHKRKA